MGLTLCGALAQLGQQRRFPIFKRFIHVNIAINPTAETIRSKRGELRVELASKFAEVLIVTIAKRQHCIREIFETRKVLQTKLLVKRLHTLRGIAVTVGTGYEQSVFLRSQGSGAVTYQR